MALSDLMIKTPDAMYFDAGFRRALEDHLTYFRTHPTTSVASVTAHNLEVYEFDFYGLLYEMKVEPELHYIVMRLAGLTGSTDSFKHLELLYVPDVQVVAKRMQVYKAKKRN